MKGHEADDDDDCTGKDARRTGTSYCSTNDENNRVGSSPTYCRPDFKYADSAEKDPLGVVEGVDSAHEELERACSEHVDAAVPSNIIEGVEFIGDGRNSGCDDCAVLMRLVLSLEALEG